MVKIVQGKAIGNLFHSGIHPWVPTTLKHRRGGLSRPRSKVDSNVANSKPTDSLLQQDLDEGRGFELYVLHQSVNLAGSIGVEFLVETQSLNLTPIINALIPLTA